jgi:hypothetical protein
MIKGDAVKLPQAVFAAAVACLPLGGCVGDDNGVKQVAKLGNFATTAPTPRDFVQQSRPGTKVERPARKMTPAEFRSIEADLDARRTRNEAAGAAAKAAGATAPPSPITVPRP